MKKLRIKKYLKLGLKINLVEIIPGVVIGLILLLLNTNLEYPEFIDFVVLGFVGLLALYLTGFFINKWKKWIFK